ncbi:MAG: S8 family serine peptidase, partial [Actinobacteria bacterium]|nr:S8 family serine peptidase [Actinomycetota bacterium]
MAAGFGTTFFGRWTALFVALFLGVPPFANSVATAIADDGPSPGVPTACVTPIGDTSLVDDSVPSPECPDVVVSLTVTPGLNSALVSWQPPANAAAAQVTAYVIDVRSQSRVVTVAATETSATITGLANGLEVDFAVHAVSSLGAGPASATVTTTPTTGVEGEVVGLIVKFSSDVTVGDTIEFVGPLDTSIELPVVDEVAGDVVLVELPDSISVDDAEAIADEIADEPGVEWVEPDRFVFVAETGVDGSSTPNDTQWSSSQWNLWDRFGVGVADGNTAVADGWSRGSGEGSVVAVIDTGITSHPDLDQRLVPGYDFVSDPAELAATRVSGGADAPFDGDYVDPIAFGSLGRDDNPTDPGDWRDVTPVRDSTWHGTAMAGVIAARANDSLGVAGVAPSARVQPVRALSWRGGLLSDIAASITWASGGAVDGAPANATPANVINLSFAVESACPASLQEAIDGAISRGAVVIAAAGNASSNASMFAPGNCDGVVNVGATGRDGRRAPYSNWGTAVDVSAPGGSTDGTVTSTSNSGVTNPAGHSWSTAEGTSVAAAHVAGAVAVLRGANPSLTVGEVVERLTGRDHVKQFGGTTCDSDPSKTCGAGILDLAQIAVSRQGSVDYSMTLNGINQYLSAPDNTAFDVTTAATFSAWLKPTSGCGSGLKTFLRKEGSYALGCVDGTWHWALAGSSGWYNNGWVNTNHRVQYGVWQHVALTFSSNTVKFYVDGQEVSAGSTTGSILNSTSVLNVGAEGTIFFPGDIDELRIYSSARTLADIQTDMHSHGLSTSIPSLQAYFDFNDGTGTTVYNRVNNAASTTHLTAVGSPNFVDVKTTEVSGSDTVVTFGRSYLSSVGGWVVPAGVTTAQILAVGGGGGGGAHVGGGGGGGGFITATSAVPSLQSLKVVVGQGGVGGKLVTACLNPCLSSRQATSGGNSAVIGGSVSLDAVGGGSGGHWDYYAPRSGGSGGGSGNGSVSAGAGTSGQGSAGGIGHTANVNGGGGGGAGGIGGAGTSSNGGSGGLGLSSSISGAAVFYAGGGGGGVHTSGTAGSGGSGVGGTGVVASGTKAGDGVDGRGGGGGGAGRTNASPSEGGDGGSGVVIVRYATASERCTPERTTEGSYTVLAFKDVGTCTWTVPAGVTNVDYLVVGGGGGGGAFVGGGGGAGGLRSGTGLLLRPEQSVSIVVGDGGAGGEVIAGGGGAQASNGGTSSISGTGITTVSGTGGGGGGGGGNSGATRDNGSSGGSGGGAVYGGSLSSVGTGVAGEGSNGALGFTRDSAPACYAAGGGGGAGTAGAAGSDCRGGGGGIGAVTTLISATSASRLRVGENVSGSVYLAGGGAGGAFGNTAQPISAGGSGGGGAGSQAGSGASGLDFTGGGGGGGGAQSDASGGDGGSGVVILRYEVQDIDFAMSFDGSTQFASGGAPSLTTDLTIEAWAYPTTPCSSEQFVLFQENRFGVSCSGGTWRLIYKDVSSGGAWVAHDTGTSVLSSQWQHLAVRRVDSTGVITFSLNGQDVFTTTDLDDWAASSDPLFVGKAGNNAKNFAGRVDEVKLWNSTRTQAQIAAGMHARPDVSLANLLAYYDFNEGTGSTVYNRKVGATSSTHLTTTSSPTFVDVKSVDVSSVAGRSIVTFPRSYITAAGGWTVPQGVTSAQYLVVGGGGGGGSRHGGGGGAGGFRTGTASVVAGSVNPVIVGQGGKGVAEVSNAAYNGIAANNGQDSSVLGFTSLGGGRGAAAGGAATSGGSGGG